MKNAELESSFAQIASVTYNLNRIIRRFYGEKKMEKLKQYLFTNWKGRMSTIYDFKHNIFLEK